MPEPHGMCSILSRLSRTLLWKQVTSALLVLDFQSWMPNCSGLARYSCEHPCSLHMCMHAGAWPAPAIPAFFCQFQSQRSGCACPEMRPAPRPSMSKPHALLADFLLLPLPCS